MSGENEIESQLSYDTSRPGESPGMFSAMRVLQVMASPGWGGLEKVFADLVNRLDSSCDVMVMTPEGAEVLERLSGDIPVDTLPRGSRRNPITIWKLAGEIRRLRPDIVHSHAAKAAEMVHWATRWMRIPHVATKHNTRSRSIFGRVDRVVAVSRAVAETVDNPRGARVIYDGIEVGPRPARDLPDVFTIVAVGRLHPAKGFDLLIRQTAELTFPFRLRVVGEGPERSALETLIGELGLADRVALLGHREEVPELLAGAHVQVVSSRTEGFSLALAEGLHYANALLSTAVGVAPEVLPREMIVRHDTIARALASVRSSYDEAVARLDDVRRLEGGRFVLSETARSYVELYREVLGRA